MQLAYNSLVLIEPFRTYDYFNIEVNTIISEPWATNLGYIPVIVDTKNFTPRRQRRLRGENDPTCRRSTYNIQSDPKIPGRVAIIVASSEVQARLQLQLPTCTALLMMSYTIIIHSYIIDITYTACLYIFLQNQL